MERNWLIGYRIAEEELKGNDRADYGIELIKKLSKELTKEYGKGFDFKLEEFNKFDFEKNKEKYVNNLKIFLSEKTLIIEHCYKFLINKQGIGMKKKRLSKLGVQEHYKEILIPNIIIDF